MHEAAAAASLLREVLRRCEANPGAICRVRVLAPGWEQPEVESLQFHWGLVTQQTRAAGSRLEVTLQAGAVRCLDCGWSGEVPASAGPAAKAVCGRCSGGDLLPLTHEESHLIVEEIEIVPRT